MGIPVKLEAFEGPLDLLLNLIEKNKINIYDIPIVEITDQYMEYINAMQERHLEIVSEFLVMAATLIDIKAKMLLPKVINDEGIEEDPRTELVEKLLEYKMYKYMSYELKDRQIDAQKSLFRQADIPDEVLKYEAPVDLDKLLENVTLDKLNSIFSFVIKKREDMVDPIRSRFGNIEKEEVNLKDKTEYVLDFIKSHKEFNFKDLLEQQSSKIHIIVTFLAILELIKTGTVIIEQKATFDDIYVKAA